MLHFDVCSSSGESLLKLLFENHDATAFYVALIPLTIDIFHDPFRSFCPRHSDMVRRKAWLMIGEQALRTLLYVSCA